MKFEYWRNLHVTAVILFVAFVLLSTVGCASEPLEPDTPLMWEVKNGDATLYLFGTIHVGTKDIYPLSHTIMDAYENSDYLMLELDYKSVTEDDTADFEKYSDETNVSDVIGAELFEKVKTVLEKECPNLKFHTLESLKPMMLQRYLLQAAYKRAGLSDRYGVDVYLLNFATKEGKAILGIETYQQQMEYINSYTTDVLIYELECTIDVGKNVEFIGNEYLAWRRGDAVAIEEMELQPGREEVQKTNEGQFIYELMVLERNNRMTDAAEQCLKDGNNIFMAVGIAHLVGEEGVVAQLRERGYDVVLLSGTEAP